jgi:3',5'-cyclic AMP phosphodiesterase CpdA
VSFSVAHFSDLHLGPLPPGATLHDFRAKRLLGALSWHARRKKLHDPNIADALRSDILNSKPDHIAFTGDGVNIASPKEFPPLLKWMESFGAADFVSYVPGNHDAYVKTAHETSFGLLEPYMRGDMRTDQTFPYVRLRHNVALIGLNSAIPRGFHSAEGRLGSAQCEALRQRLVELKGKGFYRLVMIHHPPATGIATKYRRLIDAPELMAVLVEAGAELVIHGHNHRREMNWLEAGPVRIPLIGVPSATMALPHHAAEWNLYSITRNGGRWQTQVSIRGWQGVDKGFQTVGTFTLDEVA